jgi:hypothetical protein
MAKVFLAGGALAVGRGAAAGAVETAGDGSPAGLPGVASFIAVTFHDPNVSRTSRHR